MSEKQDSIREELDEWLAQGKIDRATYDRLIAEETGEPEDEPLGPGLLTGAGGCALGLGLLYLLIVRFEHDADLLWRTALIAALGFSLVGSWLVRRTQLGELGRVLAIVAGFMWPLGFWVWLLRDPDRDIPQWVMLVPAAGEFLIAYLSTSAVVLVFGCAWLVPGIFLYLYDPHDPLTFGGSMTLLAAIGAAYLVAAREHLVWRWPRQVWLRFAAGYQVLGLWLINWSTYLLAWNGWDGEGYNDVGARLLWVTVTVLLYSLEVWAGQSSKMPWVAALGIYQFILQIIGILSYHLLSLEQRAVIIIAYAVVLILVAQGESASRRRSR